jgi:hypothetical protein
MPDAFTHDQAVLRKNHADRHVASIRPPLSTRGDLPQSAAGSRAA